MAPLMCMAGGRNREAGAYFAANAIGKVIHDAMVIFEDAVIRIPHEAFIYREANGPFKNPGMFAKYRYSRLANRPSWASNEEWEL